MRSCCSVNRRTVIGQPLKRSRNFTYTGWRRAVRAGSMLDWGVAATPQQVDDPVMTDQMQCTTMIK